MDVFDRFDAMDREVSSTLKQVFKVTLYEVGDPNSNPPEHLSEKLKAFYNSINHLNYEWETKEIINANGQKLVGRINILKADSVLSDWKEVVYFDGDSQELKQFKIVDNFVPEAHCGFLLNEDKSDAMYYHETGEPDLLPMGVDFSGYLELLFMARGFWYWQRAVLHIKNGTRYVESEQFKTYMPQIFPDFKWVEFVALYEKVRIK